MNSNRFDRQSFLGKSSQQAIHDAVVGVVGLGGGGTHIVQQLAHLGFMNYITADPDVTKIHNLNRMVGATLRDADLKVPKIEIATRVIRSLEPQAKIEAYKDVWQVHAAAFRRCNVIVGALDGFDQRRQLETLSRNFLIPYVDIGMEVTWVQPEPPQMAGQVILSMPGFACMRCMGFLTDKGLANEAGQYGDAGARPQVVWANGVLASTAVGIVIDLVTDWTRSLRTSVYLSYRGNLGVVSTHARVPYVELNQCPHYPLSNVGTPRIRSPI